MFRRMAKFLGQDGAVQLMRLHPADLTALLEFGWDKRSNNPQKALGDPARRSDLNGFGTTWFGASAFDIEKIPDQTITDVVNGLNITVSSPNEDSNMARDANLFDHAIYAFMIENTRVYDIFR